MKIRAAKPLLPTAELRRRGWTRAALAEAVKNGSLWHVHRGWYAEPGTDAQLIAAMRLGGRLGCVSALRLAGGWTPPDARMHVAMPASASGRRLERVAGEGVVVHWHSPLGTPHWKDDISPLDIAVAHCASCLPLDMAAAVLDSLLHRSVVDTALLLRVRDALPGSARAVFALLDERSEEGIETLARVRLRLIGIDAVPQVSIDGIGRVDLLIDGWLVVELDGRETHAQQAAFSRDRRRTARLHQRGYTVLHFSYAHVVHEWELVRDTVLAALARRRPGAQQENRALSR